MQVKYTGPLLEVEVPDAGIVAEQGKAVTVDSDVGKRLLEQDCWAEARKSATKEEK